MTEKINWLKIDNSLLRQRLTKYFTTPDDVGKSMQEVAEEYFNNKDKGVWLQLLQYTYGVIRWFETNGMDVGAYRFEFDEGLKELRSVVAPQDLQSIKGYITLDEAKTIEERRKPKNHYYVVDYPKIRAIMDDYGMTEKSISSDCNMKAPHPLKNWRESYNEQSQGGAISDLAKFADFVNVDLKDLLKLKLN